MPSAIKMTAGICKATKHERLNVNKQQFVQSDKKIAVAALILCGPVFGTFFGDVVMIAVEESQLREVAEGAADAAARELKLFDADPGQIENSRRRLTGCSVEVEVVKSFARTEGDVRIRTVLINQRTGVQVTVSQKWTSFYYRLFSLPAKKIKSTAIAQLQGSGKVRLIQLKSYPHPDNQVGLISNQLREHCGA